MSDNTATDVTALATRSPAAPSAADVRKPAKMGRPTAITPQVIDRICESLATGMTLREFCRRNPDVSYTTIMHRQVADEDFRNRIARAQELQAECWADELVHLTEDPPLVNVPGRHGDYQIVDNGAVQLRKLRADNLKWLMSRRNPRAFGDKLQHTGADGGPMQVMMAVWQSPQGKSDPDSE